ncbi:MAG: cobalt-zinc-cadmium efflux system protein [Tenuifilum sp.]|jgi:cobalt-zinc-cadmium efflux system protein|uniref:cation diffusion facilitator family transporter n=1 Tax=Tenuifilum sp. TaxID=2760880 RepID=UPI0024ABF3F2|nr:cation diffusion facilitator family transporter [Tenuifilum sp.]MDI3527707.1 cobalt-zinc-cadmium efflux system protein [Tenuifilum sp.]
MENEKHHHHHEVSGKNLGIAILLNVLITIAEVVGGFVSGSMALLSDATHNFSDVLSLIISYVANKVASKKATPSRTFGLKRSEILAAFINSATLMGLAIVILVEGTKRLFTTVSINSSWVIWLAFLSIVVNGLSVLFIRNDSHKNINIKSAYLHLLSDMLTSIAVLAGGLAMKYLQWYWVDAVFSIVIAIYLIFTSWGIFKTSLKIFMQFSPEGINLNPIINEIEDIQGVKNIHHVHVWQIDEHEIMFEAHLDVNEDIKISDFEVILKQVKDTLAKRGINHITIQPEYSVSDSKQLIH